ncbi:NAD(P)-dependent oxidoreductase [Mycolicibacterium tusciae]|uniref:6-phosphogluconate dehydrogenase n=1 Tax=Mycolicibacterium tusciae TaxID=75922 RepID=A0A1X0JET5_9MYCO|nr:NAD(P)-binding domain-containing protein [Mycolicibacterium tusciae]ORB61429.1 6-phosphogluconate dehydrogenase [Mycolicibacterium tusciae]
MRRVGVVGLGGMGSALAASLLATDHSVVCFDIRPDVLRPVVELGAQSAGDARELAGACDVVLTVLPGPTQVLEVALGSERGVLAGLPEGAALLDMSTCNPEVAAVIGQAYDAVGRRFVDCPVSRKAPDLTVLVGGPRGVLGPDADVLAAVARTLVYCGQRGAGYATKLLNQHVKYSWYLASAEALLIAEAMGLKASEVAEAIAECSGGDSGLTTAAAYFRHDTEFVRSRAPASTIEKDSALVERMATNAGIRSRTLAVVVDFFQSVAASEFRDRAYPESTKLLKRIRSMPPKSTSTP